VSVGATSRYLALDRAGYWKRLELGVAAAREACRERDHGLTQPLTAMGCWRG